MHHNNHTVGCPDSNTRGALSNGTPIDDIWNNELPDTESIHDININNNLHMVINTIKNTVRGFTLMFLAGTTLCTGVRILVDTGATNNIINVMVARALNIHEHNTGLTITVGNGMTVPCNAVAFTVPLCINEARFDIDTYILDIGNKVDVILGMPWLVNLGCVFWDFINMQLMCIIGEKLFCFNAETPRHDHNFDATAAIRAITMTTSPATLHNFNNTTILLQLRGSSITEPEIRITNKFSIQQRQA
jgi:hypothetical protein